MNIKELKHFAEQVKLFVKDYQRRETHCIRCKHTFDDCMTCSQPCRYEQACDVLEEIMDLDEDKEVHISESD